VPVDPQRSSLIPFVHMLPSPQHPPLQGELAEHAAVHAPFVQAIAGGQSVACIQEAEQVSPCEHMNPLQHPPLHGEPGVHIGEHVWFVQAMPGAHSLAAVHVDEQAFATQALLVGQSAPETQATQAPEPEHPGVGAAQRWHAPPVFPHARVAEPSAQLPSAQHPPLQEEEDEHDVPQAPLEQASFGGQSDAVMHVFAPSPCAPLSVAESRDASGFSLAESRDASGFSLAESRDASGFSLASGVASRTCASRESLDVFETATPPSAMSVTSWNPHRSAHAARASGLATTRANIARVALGARPSQRSLLS
jgi:hypothetical protein